MNIKTTLKASVAAAALVAVAAPVVSSPAAAGAINDAGDKNSVTISGQLARSVLYMDNGEDQEWQHVDGGNDTNSRLRILVNGELTENIKVGGVWEANLPSSNAAGSAAVSNDTETSAGEPGTFGFRKTSIAFTHSTMGKLTIGQNSTSSDNKPSLDSTGNNNAGMTYGGNTVYTTTAGADSATAGAAFSSYFGGRNDSIRYDTPDIMGFGLSASLVEGDNWDAGITYGADYSGIQIAAAAQYQSKNTAQQSAQYGAGIALKHTASGLSAGAHFGRETNNSNRTAVVGVSGQQWGAEVGYTTSAVSNLGATSASLIYVNSEDAATAGVEATLWGFHVKQGLPAGVDIFASYENASFEDNTATNYNDVSTALVGTMIAF